MCSNNSNKSLMCALLRLCSRQVLAQNITVSPLLNGSEVY